MRFRIAVVALVGALSAGPARAGDVVEGLVQALLLVCLPSQVTATPVEAFMGETGLLAKGSPPIATERLAGADETRLLRGRPGLAFRWGPAEQQGFVTSQNRSCSVVSTFSDGAEVAKAWERWLVGPDLPFKVTRRDGDHVLSMTYYEGKVGARFLSAVIAHRNPPSKDGVTATIVVAGFND
ncbi:MAG: hypothetical protein NW215_00905 [Hyphomicrobiales bacterium]|nr:hypothetical protein [Hyphomicrobiales bacterium]